MRVPLTDDVLTTIDRSWARRTRGVLTLAQVTGDWMSDAAQPLVVAPKRDAVDVCVLLQHRPALTVQVSAKPQIDDVADHAKHAIAVKVASGACDALLKLQVRPRASRR